MAWVLPSDPAVGDFIKASWGQAVYDCLVFLATVIDTSTGKIASGAFKTSTEQESASSGVGVALADGNFVFASVGRFGFHGFIQWSGGSQAAGDFNFSTGNCSASEEIRIGYHDMNTPAGGTAYTVYGTLPYVQACGPYEFGGMTLPADYPWLLVLRRPDGTIDRGWCAEDPWFYLRTRGKLPKNHPAAMMQYPHPFVEMVVDIKPGWSVEMVDCRELLDPVDFNPEADILANLEAEAQNHAALGIPPGLIEAGIATQRVIAAKCQTIRTTSASLLRMQLDKQGKGFLHLAHEGWSITDRATRCLSDDTKHPDHKHLPKIPGLFIPDTDGKPPLVRVMTQP